MDLRLPVGIMFLLLGLILAAYGWWFPNDIAPRDLGLQINLVWGCVLAGFGLAMIGSAMRARNESRKRAQGCGTSAGTRY
jgi:hypothetical protein